jgi:hypothetical protein
MAKQKNSKGPKEPGGPKHPQGPNEHDPDRERPKHKPEGREHQVHKEILKRRMRGGPEPTPEDYARALEQWKKLPGSVVRPPTDVTLPPQEEPSGPSGQGNPPPQPDVENKDG